MTTQVTLTADDLNRLDLTLVETILQPYLQQGSIPTGEGAQPLQIRFQIDLTRDPGDPRELSEIPEVRLWFVRLDARYPWLPLVLDWESGELVRYTAMLVPHQFSPKDGIQFNPEALELFVMHKVFVLTDWMKRQGSISRNRVKFMTKMLGYELEDGLFELLSA